jgi:AcrR family transcriptional regulator
MSADATSAAFAWKSRPPKASRPNLAARPIDMIVDATLIKRDARREAILDAAQACFLAEGYAATSMSTIAARLGGSKGTLYSYVKNKEDLFAAVVQRACTAIQQALDSLDARTGDLQPCLLR